MEKDKIIFMYHIHNPAAMMLVIHVFYFHVSNSLFTPIIRCIFSINILAFIFLPDLHHRLESTILDWLCGDASYSCVGPEARA